MFQTWAIACCAAWVDPITPYTRITSPITRPIPLPERGWETFLPICSPMTGNRDSVVPSTLFEMSRFPMKPSTVVRISRDGKIERNP